jgi:hypothetical protein
VSVVGYGVLLRTVRWNWNGCAGIPYTDCMVLRRGSAANPNIIQTEILVPDPAPPNHIVLRRSCRTAEYAKYNGVRDVRGPVICSPLYISSPGSLHPALVSTCFFHV